MLDYRHWAHAYLMYMAIPLPLMFILDLVLGAVFSQLSLGYLMTLYLVSAGIVLLYRVVAAHAHHELWREGVAAVAAAAVFFVNPLLWGAVGVAASGYLIYQWFAGGQPRQSGQQSRQRRPQG
jgi:uncharacterized membrane protein